MQFAEKGFPLNQMLLPPPSLPPPSLSCVLSNMEQKMAGMCPYQPHGERLNSIEFHPKFGCAIMH